MVKRAGRRTGRLAGMWDPERILLSSLSPLFLSIGERLQQLDREEKMIIPRAGEIAGALFLCRAKGVESAPKGGSDLSQVREKFP